MSRPYITPRYDLDSFTCPHCGTVSQHVSQEVIQSFKAAHACRHLGNDGVHEGFIYNNKDATYEIIVQMSNLLNLIVEQTIGLEEQTKKLMNKHDNRK